MMINDVFYHHGPESNFKVRLKNLLGGLPNIRDGRMFTFVECFTGSFVPIL